MLKCMSKDHKKHNNRRHPNNVLYNRRHVRISSSWIITAQESPLNAFPDTDPRDAEVLAARGAPREPWRHDQTWVGCCSLHVGHTDRHRPTTATNLQ